MARTQIREKKLIIVNYNFKLKIVPLAVNWLTFEFK